MLHLIMSTPMQNMAYQCGATKLHSRRSPFRLPVHSRNNTLPANEFKHVCSTKQTALAHDFKRQKGPLHGLVFFYDIMRTCTAQPVP